MKYFTKIDDGAAVIAQDGIYWQVDLYVRGGFPYARKGSGFVRLLPNGVTSNPKIKWDEIDAPHGHLDVEAGRLKYVNDSD